MKKILAISVLVCFILLEVLPAFCESGYGDIFRRKIKSRKVDLIADYICYYQEYPNRSVVVVSASRPFDVGYDVRNRSNVSVPGAIITINFKLNGRTVRPSIHATMDVPSGGRKYSGRTNGITLSTPGTYDVEFKVDVPSTVFFRDTDQSNSVRYSTLLVR